MHAGKGGVNLGKIDNLVQRDATDNLPCINDTSLKGALKEYANHLVKAKALNSDEVEKIFGSESKAGAYSIQQAYLLSIPVPCSHKPFYRATSSLVLRGLSERLSFFGNTGNLKAELDDFIKIIEPKVDKGKGLVFESDSSVKYFEDFNLQSKPVDSIAVPASVAKLLGDDLVIFEEDDFARLTNDEHLPSIPRNKLDNGESKNLWYEQLLPRETRMYFTVLQPKSDEASNVFKDTFNTKVVQIGANASVGYGWCVLNNF
jgi:CRISPR-associated protein Cmr4